MLGRCIGSRTHHVSNGLFFVAPFLFGSTELQYFNSSSSNTDRSPLGFTSDTPLALRLESNKKKSYTVHTVLGGEVLESTAACLRVYRNVIVFVYLSIFFSCSVAIATLIYAVPRVEKVRS